MVPALGLLPSKDSSEVYALDGYTAGAPEKSASYLRRTGDAGASYARCSIKPWDVLSKKDRIRDRGVHLFARSRFVSWLIGCAQAQVPIGQEPWCRGAAASLTAPVLSYLA